MRPTYPRVLDLEAPVHHHRDATLLGDPRALGVDYPELAPQAPAPIATASRAISRQRVRGAEDVDDVHGSGRPQARVAGLAEDLGLAGLTGITGTRGA
jgi:hypothetical protein